MNLIEHELDNQGILTLTLNRPEKLNALSSEVLDALAESFGDARTNSKVKALMITGNGKAFVQGLTLTDSLNVPRKPGMNLHVEAKRCLNFWRLWENPP